MRLQHCLSWSLSLLLLLLLSCRYQCVSVHFQTLQPVNVLPAGRLVLQVQIDRGPKENISMITWEREPENAKPPGNPGKVTLITFPGQERRLDGRLSVEQQGAILKLEGFGVADSGVYIVTVTDQAGVKTSAQYIVKEY
ncbi:uncharacterized protein LOC121558153, partial [Coregonus clupeaformis]|uniref:uncharacterized protein LOC121558153 n=1 Tax=Coregonus clupeaformis TaxID=59861 RepID=UPI001E1C6A2F